MNDVHAPKTVLRLTMGVGFVLILAAVVWLIVLFAGGDGAAEVSSSQRPPTPSDVPTASASSTPSSEPTPSARPSQSVEGAGPDATVLPTRVAGDVTPAADPPTPSPDPTVAPEPSAEASLPEFTATLLVDTDLGTGSSEFSAVALNEDSNRLLIADDEGRIFEFDLDDTGGPITPPRRVLRVGVGAGDIEGIAWMSGSTYAIAHEDDGRLTIVTIDEQSSTITDEHLVRNIDTGIREVDGSGLEGVGYFGASTDGFEFAVVDERPPLLVLINAEGAVSKSLPLTVGVSDVSDVWVAPDGGITIVSDESRLVIDLAIDGDSVTAAGSLSLQLDDGLFVQPEGVVRSQDGTRLYVVGEAPGPGRFSLGYWTATD